MNKKLIGFILIFFTKMLFAQAPAIQWQKTLGAGYVDQPSAIKQTVDGGYIFVGSAVLGVHLYYEDYWVVKLNSNGTVQWQKALGGNYLDFASDIKQTTDGGYIVAGYSSSYDGDVTGSDGTGNYWIAKLSNSGDIQWQKVLGGSKSDFATSIQQTLDGGYIVVGRASSTDGDVTGNHGSSDYWIVKLNESGGIQWQKSLGGSGSDSAKSIQQTSDGGYIVAGSSSSKDGDVTGNHGNSDSWIVKLNNSGDIQWQKSLGGSSSDSANSIQQTSDGGYIVAGESSSYDGDLSGNSPYNMSDFWIVKLSAGGIIQWQKSLGGSSDDIANSIQQTSDGGYIVAGSSWSKDRNVTGNHGGADYWIVKLNDSGTIQWQKSLGGREADYLSAIQQTSDKGYILTGHSWSKDGDVTGSTGTSSDYWIVKLNPENLNTNEIASKNKVLVENPVKSKLNIHSNQSILSLRLYNIDGKLVRSSGNKNMLVSDIPKGNYVLTIQLENGQVISQKIIKE